MRTLKILIAGSVLLTSVSAAIAAEKWPPAPACIKHQKKSEVHCVNNDSLTVEVINNCDKNAEVKICIGKRGMSQDDCGTVHINVGKSDSYWSCKPTGKYTVYARAMVEPKLGKPKAHKVTREQCEELHAFWVEGRCIAD